MQLIFHFAYNFIFFLIIRKKIEKLYKQDRKIEAIAKKTLANLRIIVEFNVERQHFSQFLLINLVEIMHCRIYIRCIKNVGITRYIIRTNFDLSINQLSENF